MSELEALESLHRAAQARLGFAVAFLSKKRWGSVQATAPGTGGSEWADAVASAVVEAQEISSTLAATYYQLARALEIGVTMGLPLNGAPATLGAYRDSFIEQVLDVDLLGEDSSLSPLHEAVDPSPDLSRLDLGPSVQRFFDTMEERRDANAIQAEAYTWGSIRDDEDRVADALYQDAVASLTKQVKEIRQGEDRGGQVLALEDAHEKKGAVGAGNADQLVMRAGRAVLEGAQVRDRKVLKYARGTAANPCHFCAMLASRGFVYVSRSSAMETYRTGGLRSYHPNCHCFPIARWSDASPLPQLNREFQELWNAEIRNKYSGRAALREWRRIITARQKDLMTTPIETDK